MWRVLDFYIGLTHPYKTSL